MVDSLEALRALLGLILPGGWVEAAERGDEAGLAAAQAKLDRDGVIAALGAEGWVAPTWPVEHGGRGLDPATARAATELLDVLDVPRVPRGSGLTLAAPTILAHASEATKRRLLPPIVTGEERWAQLFSEPGAGSDLASLACRAERDGDDWVVNGQKVWTTLAQDCQMGMLLARTDPTVPKRDGITYFAVDLRAPGVEIRPLVQMTGECEFNEIFLTDVRIPDLFRISDVGAGWAAARTTLTAERMALSGQRGRQRARRGILGGLTIDEVRTLAAQADPSPPERDQLAAAVIDERVLGWTVARMRGPAGSITKIAKATTNQDRQVLALRLLGARATAWPTDDAATARAVRQFLRTRANSIEGGTSEIQRTIVGEQVLGLPREPDPYRGARWDEVARS